MAIKVTLFIVFILGILVFAGLAGFKAYQHWDDEDEHGVIAPIVFGVLSLVMLICTICIPGNIHQVNTGEVAVVRHMGKVTGTREAGIYWDWYFTNDYEMYDTKVKEINIDTQTYSSDNQIIGVKADLQYTIDSTQVDKIATEYGSIDKLESKINSIALDNIKSVFAKSNATEIIANRNNISQSISKIVDSSVNPKYFIKDNDEYVRVFDLSNTGLTYYRLSYVYTQVGVDDDGKSVYDWVENYSKASELTSYYVKVKTIVMTNIDFTDDFEAKVAEKVAAEQEALKAKNEAEKAKIEAEAAKQVAILQAQAEAESSLAKANAAAEVARIKAEADQKVAKIEADTALYAGQKNAAIAIQKLAGINGWSVVTMTEDPNNTPDYSLDDIITYKLVKYVDNDYVAVTTEELAKGVEKLIEVYKYEAWDGKLPTYQMGENGFIAVTTQP